MVAYLGIGVYLAFCLLVAFSGRKVRIGFWGVLVLSILITPLIAAILIVILRPKLKEKDPYRELYD